MRLYLSSFRIGNQPAELLNLIRGNGRTALIPNAADTYEDPADRELSVERDRASLVALGLEPIIVDLRQYFGKDPELGNVLHSCDALYARGGNAFVLRRALRQSGADEIIESLLAQDALVYAGYSAGSCVLAPSLHGLELVDDPNIVPSGYDSEVIWEGLGLLPFYLLPHYRSPEHPESARMELVYDRWSAAGLSFISLRDGQAIVVEGGRQETVG